MADSFIDNFEPADEDIEFFEELKNISRQPSCKQKFEEELHAWKCEKRFLEARALHQAGCIAKMERIIRMQRDIKKQAGVLLEIMQIVLGDGTQKKEHD